MEHDAANSEQLDLAEIIAQKVKQKKSDLESIISEEGVPDHYIDPKWADVCKTVGKALRHYRSGKLPKIFKIIPSMRDWEKMLWHTEPLQWSAAAMYQATRLFVSALPKGMAQRFCAVVLLPRIRDDLKEYQKLNSYLYRALEYALFKPDAFMKGIVLTLVDDTENPANMREAIIVSSVLAHKSVPVLHSAACLLKLCERDYNPVNAIFIRDLLDKRYALPYRVLTAVFEHFMKYKKRHAESMPVLWHQCLLSFAQRYKHDLTEEQKQSLLQLVAKQTHPDITPEILRELRGDASGANKKTNEHVESMEL